MALYNEDFFVAVASEPIMPQVNTNVRVVYPIGKDTWEGGVGEGLAFLKQLLQKYEEAGIPLEEVHISAIFHSGASYMVLRDEAYRRVGHKEGENPNKEIINELLDKGVSLEICEMSMGKLGIARADLLPEISVVQSTFTRVIDLEMQGYAFIDF